MTFDHVLAVLNTVMFVILVATLAYYIRRIHIENTKAHKEIQQQDRQGRADDI